MEGVSLASGRNYTEVQNLKGGKGSVFVSDDWTIDNNTFCFMIIPPGSSIGMHKHPKEEGTSEIYFLYEGEKMNVNGIDCKWSRCGIGCSHDCKNLTDKAIIILSIKTKWY